MDDISPGFRQYETLVITVVIMLRKHAETFRLYSNGGLVSYLLSLPIRKFEWSEKSGHILKDGESVKPL